MYNYQTERPKLFTEEGQEMFLKVRDRAKELLRIAGAFRQQEVLATVCGDSWLELGEIAEIPRDCWGQYKVYSTKKVHNL